MKRNFVLLASVALLALSGSAFGQVFDVTLSGSRQVPANDSDAVGRCLAYLSEAQTQLTVICSHNVVGASAAHIHVGAPGEIGPVALPFSSPSSPMKGIFSVTAADVNNLLGGSMYVNVHSPTFPGGEIRGQIGPKADSSVYFPLEGAQENPPVTSSASGACMGALNTLRTSFAIACTHNLQSVSASHIHRSPAGINGPVVFGLGPATTVIAEVNMNNLPATPGFDAFLDDLWYENLYVNVHSPANPGGEIRGQIPRPPLALYFPQFGSGGGTPAPDATPGFTSAVVLTNNSTTTPDAQGTVYFLDTDGLPLPVGIIGGTGVIPPGVPVSQVDFTLPPLGTVTFQTDGLGDIVLGSAEVVSDGPVGGTIRFSIPGIGIAGFGSAPAMQRAIVPVRNEGILRTAVAVRNNESQAITVTVELLDPDGLVPAGVDPADAVVQASVPGNGRAAQFIDEIFEQADLGDFVGSVVISVEEGSFSAIALELDQTVPGIFTSLPVSPLVGP